MASGAGQKIYTLPRVVIASGGVAQQISATEFATSSILLQADSSNTGAVYIGDSNVTADNGVAIFPNGTLTLEADFERYSEFDVSDLYAVSGTAGNILRVLCTRRRK